MNKTNEIEISQWYDQYIQNANVASLNVAQVKEGVRFDEGKLKWYLLPFDGLRELVKVYTRGAIKYAPRSWEKGMDWSRILDSMLRHLDARLSGEKNDPETGLPHLAHMTWNAMALLVYELRGIGKDDISRQSE